MINERKNDIEDKNKNEDKNRTNTINNQNRNEETKKDLNETETDLKKKNPLYNSYNIFNKAKEKQDNNMKNGIIQKKKYPHSDFFKVDYSKIKSMDSNENTITNFKNTNLDINNLASILENKGIDGIPVKIMVGDNVKVSQNEVRVILTKILYGENYCKTCCNIFRCFCKVIKILLIILLFGLYMITGCCFCNCCCCGSYKSFEGSLICCSNIPNFICLIFRENRMDHCCDCCLYKCRCCHKCCNC